MKSVLWLFILLSVMMVVHAKDDDENENERQIRPHNAIHLDCFDAFIPIINRLTIDAKETAGACVASAEAQKESELISINRTRSELFTEVKRIKETLSTCSTQNDHVGYFECLRGIVETDRKIVGDISMKSSKYSNKIKDIEEHQIRCFEHAIHKIKEKSSNAMHILQYCLTSKESVRYGDSFGARDTTSTTKIMHTTPNYRSHYNF